MELLRLLNKKPVGCNSRISSQAYTAEPGCQRSCSYQIRKVGAYKTRRHPVLCTSPWAAKWATATGSEQLNCAPFKKPVQNQEAATVASEAHIMPALLLSRIYFCSMGKPQRQRTSAATHTGQMHAQHPIYLSSNFKRHVTASEMEAESNLDHQLKTNWRNLF